MYPPAKLLLNGHPFEVEFGASLPENQYGENSPSLGYIKVAPVAAWKYVLLHELAHMLGEFAGCSPTEEQCDAVAAQVLGLLAHNKAFVRALLED